MALLSNDNGTIIVVVDSYEIGGCYAWLLEESKTTMNDD